MINDKEAGIHCDECGYEKKVYTPEDSSKLNRSLAWADTGNPICPECGVDADFEDYIDD